MAILLPELGEGPLFMKSAEACRLDSNCLHNPPHVGMSTVVSTYVCPSDGRLLYPQVDVFGYIASFASYIGIGGTFPPDGIGHMGVLGFIPGCRLSDISDGTSNTLMVGERPPPSSLIAGWWYPTYSGFANRRGPNNDLILGGPVFPGDPCVGGKGTFGPGLLENDCDRYHLWSLHAGGANFLFADGSARFLTYASEPLMMALGSRDGGEEVSLP
jgi:prepilin-type processing-associated H-X9-DG protein